MTSNKPANPLELLSYILALQIEDHQVVYVGTGLPMVAAILAKKTHAPNITMVYESGGQNPIEGDMPLVGRRSLHVAQIAHDSGDGLFFCPVLQRLRGYRLSRLCAGRYVRECQHAYDRDRFSQAEVPPDRVRRQQ